MNKKKALQDNPLLDENTALDAFFDGRETSSRLSLTKNPPKTTKKQVKATESAVKQPKKIIGKPRSFGNSSLQKITAEIPQELVRQFNVLVAKKSSRLNYELAEAMKLHLKRVS